MNRPIILLGRERKLVDLPDLLFFGCFHSSVETRSAIPYTTSEAYFFDLRRGRGTILPYYATNLDGSVREFADSVSLDFVHPENELPLIPEVCYSAMVNGTKIEIWKCCLPVKWHEAITTAFDEFHTFYPLMPAACNM